jgi:hypothetical protein
MSNEETPIVEETPVVAEAAAEVVEVVEPAAVVAEEPQPEPKKNHAVKSGVGIVVSGNDFDEVRLDMCVYKNPAARKSLSVHHLQRRLFELGYREAGTDKDGWYGDSTKLAVEAFQAANNLAVTGAVDAGMLETIFADEPFINVVCC